MVLGLFALNNLQLDLAHGSHGDADAVGGELQVLCFVLGQVVFYLFNIAEVTQFLIHTLLCIRYLLDTTLEF